MIFDKQQLFLSKVILDASSDDTSGYNQLHGYKLDDCQLNRRLLKVHDLTNKDNVEGEQKDSYNEVDKTDLVTEIALHPRIYPL